MDFDPKDPDDPQIEDASPKGLPAQFLIAILAATLFVFLMGIGAMRQPKCWLDFRSIAFGISLVLAILFVGIIGLLNRRSKVNSVKRFISMALLALATIPLIDSFSYATANYNPQSNSTFSCND